MITSDNVYLKVMPPNSLEDGQAEVKSGLKVQIVGVAELALDEAKDVIVILLAQHKLLKYTFLGGKINHYSNTRLLP